MEGQLTIVIKSTMNNGGELWYWEMKSPSGPAACFSPYFTCIEGAVQAARAFIFNMNYPHIMLTIFDDRITPTEDRNRLSIPFEAYFHTIYKNSQAVLPAEDAAIQQPIKKGHLSLVTDTQ